MLNPYGMEDHINFCHQPNRMLKRAKDGGWDGETKVARYFYNQFKMLHIENYQGLANYHLPIKGLNTLEIDLLVITTFGIFLLEVKNWGGTIRAEDDQWYHNGEPHGNVFGIASEKAKIISSKLRQIHINGLSCYPDAISVASLIVLVQGTQRFTNQSRVYKTDRSVVGLNKQFIQLLTSSEITHPGKKPTRLTNNDINLLRNALFREHKPDEREIVGDYRLLRELRGTDLFKAFEAQNIHAQEHEPPVRLKSYKLNVSGNKSVIKQTIDRYRRDHAVIRSLGHHSHIVESTNFFHDPKYYDLYHEVTEFIDDERLDVWIMQTYRHNPMLLTDQLAILKPLCEALDHAHTHPVTPVYHRHVSLETVFRTRSNRSGEIVVKLADFDFAKFGTHTINSQSTQKSLDTVFTAPEVRRNASNARAYSDIYSLGILWYFLAQLPHYDPVAQFDPLKDASNIDELQELPVEARALLKRMVTYEPEERPQSAQEVLEALKQLRLAL